jgi:hypothetical protein
MAKAMSLTADEAVSNYNPIMSPPGEALAAFLIQGCRFQSSAGGIGNTMRAWVKWTKRASSCQQYQTDNTASVPW